MGDAAEIYPLGRSPAESNRLNQQHKFLIDVAEGLVNSKIPLDNISTMADVGTGTGIWLVEAQDLLNKKVSSNPNRYFHGFDISDAQFLPSPPKGIELSVQDILKPFPAEHHNRYDLVNVRMLVAALVEAEYETAVKNLMTLLKPGGYLQWIDMDSSALPDSQESKDPRCAGLVWAWLKFLQLNGLSTSAPTAIEEAYRRSGLIDVSNTLHKLNDHKEDFKPRIRQWQAQAFAAIVPTVFVRSGQEENLDKAKEKVDQMIEISWGYYNKERVVGMAFGSVVGRKA